MQCAEAWKLNARCWFWHVGEGSRFGSSCLNGLMAPQVFTLSSVLYTLLKLTTRLNIVSIQMYGTFLCE